MAPENQTRSRTESEVIDRSFTNKGVREFLLTLSSKQTMPRYEIHALALEERPIRTCRCAVEKSYGAEKEYINLLSVRL